MGLLIKIKYLEYITNTYFVSTSKQGENGVKRVLEILQEEFDIAMALTGN